MKKPLSLGAAFAAFVMLAPAVGLAAQPGPKARIFAEFDKNKNGIIDGDEIEAVRKAYAADPKGPFARYDTDHDGKLSDAEIAAILPPGKGGKPGQKKGGKKNSDAAAPTTPKSDGK